MQTKVTTCGEFDVTVVEVDGPWNKVAGTPSDALPRALLKSVYRYFIDVPDLKLQNNVYAY